MKNSPHLLKNAMGPFCVNLVLFFIYARFTDPGDSFFSSLVSGLFLTCYYFFFQYLLYRFLFSRRQENITLLYLVSMGGTLLLFLPLIFPV